MVAVLLAGEDVADVDFNGGGGDSGEGVVDGYTGVAVAAGVDDDAVGAEADLLYAVDDFAFDIALEIAYRDIGMPLSKLLKHSFHRSVAVGFYLAVTCEVEVGTVD